MNPEDSAPGLLLLIDPTWEASADQPQPALENVVGGWRLRPDGTPGRFSANPSYAPATPGSPTDPVDAVLQAAAQDGSAGQDLGSVLLETVLSVAVADDGTAVVVLAPDGVPSVVVTTAPPHRRRVGGPGWREVTVAELAAALPAEGVDVLLNPGGPASMRVLADVVRQAAADG